MNVMVYFRNAGLPVIFLVPLLFLIGCNEPNDQEKPPNIIFIMTDDHARHAVSAYGSKINQTPNIDRIADEGIRFDEAFVTNSICAPSRAVLLTGKHSHINGKRTNLDVFDSTQTTYPKLLREAGYETAMIGKWHLRSDPTGYDHWDILPGQGNYYNPDFRTPEGTHQVEGYVTDIITDKVLEWLKIERDKEKPFMLNYHHKAPHRNWMPGPDHLSLYRDEEIPEPATLYANWAGELGEREQGDEIPPGELRNRTSAVEVQEMTLMDHFSPAWDLKFPPDSVEGEWLHEIWDRAYDRLNEEQREAWDAVYNTYYEEFKQADREGEELLSWTYQRYIKDYLATIASVDDNLGRLLDYLEDAGLAENTIIVYTSDQGFFLGDDGWYDKRWMYEPSLRIPLAVRWPAGIEAGGVNSELVQNVDFAPTLLDAAGVEIPEDIQGRSLLPMMQGEHPDNWRESIYYHYYERGEHAVQPHYGVRTDRYKLIHYYEIDEWELFDLQRDSTESRSVYNDTEYAETVDDLKNELEELQERYQVTQEEMRQDTSDSND